MNILLGVITSIILCVSLCRSNLILSENSENTTFSDSSKIGVNSNSINRVTSATITFVFDDFPSDCSQRQKHKTLFKHTSSRLKKCCPIGEGLSISEEKYDGATCGSATNQFSPNLINVTLYDNCVEDMETEFNLPFQIGNPCNTSILYNDVDDLIFIVQDGSLLVMDLYANDTYTLYKNYCIDINNISGVTYAIVCLTSVEEHISRSHIVVVAVFMLISIPCLLLVAYLHIRIKELRSLHGAILSCMSISLAIGNLLYSLVHIFELNKRNTGYAVLFFMLLYYFWFLSLCCNVTINVWIHIPLNKKKSKFVTTIYFAVYFTTSIIGAVVLVILTSQKGLYGMPSYFLQGYTESIRESQRYFIPPVSTLILLSFILLTAAFFGFQRLRRVISNVNYRSKSNLSFDENVFGEVKKDAKSISFLGIILLTTWLLEIVTFYSPGPEVYLLWMDMLNGLQGAFVSLIFLGIRRRRTIIYRWWNDRGSQSTEKTELSFLNAESSTQRK